MVPRQSRVRLDMIAAEWSEERAINPRLLATELAACLRSLSPETHPIHEAFASVTITSSPVGAGPITFGALAAYFEEVADGRAPTTILAATGKVPASTVTIARSWISRPIAEAEERAHFAAGYALPANDNPVLAVTVHSVSQFSHSPPPQPSGSEAGYLKMRESHLRQKGEHCAAIELEAAKQKALLLEAENSNLVGRISLYKSKLDELNEKFRDERSARLNAVELLEDAMSRLESAETARMVAETKAEAAEMALAVAPERIADDFSNLQSSLEQAGKWFAKRSKHRQAEQAGVELLIIAGLLDLLLEHDRPPYNKGRIAEAISRKGWPGAGLRNVNGMFAEAKKAAEEAALIATSKAVDIQMSNPKK
ncbi:hypothetical protein D3C77_256740 [compost metagenome]